MLLLICFKNTDFIQLNGTIYFLQVPELYYLPEILTNENSIDFGTTQLGENLGNL